MHNLCVQNYNKRVDTSVLAKALAVERRPDSSRSPKKCTKYHTLIVIPTEKMNDSHSGDNAFLRNPGCGWNIMTTFPLAQATDHVLHVVTNTRLADKSYL